MPQRSVKRSPLSYWLALPLIGLIWFYRITLSPLLGAHCRFHPSCSRYAMDAYRRHGLIYGSYFTARRLLRCHPWGGQGEDPVPDKVDFTVKLRSKRRPHHPS